MGSSSSEKNKVKIKNLLPEDNEISQTSGKIVLRKDTDFDVLCFDINFDGYFTNHIRLWVQNHPTPTPTPEVGSVSSGQ